MGETSDFQFLVKHYRLNNSGFEKLRFEIHEVRRALLLGLINHLL